MVNDGNKCIDLIVDGIDGVTGPIRVAVTLGYFLRLRSYRVTLVTPYVNSSVKHEIQGLNIIELIGKPTLSGQLGHLWLWIRNAFREVVYRSDCITINLSFELPIPSTIFYAQGYVGDLLKDMTETAPMHYRLGYLLASPLIKAANMVYHKGIVNSRFVVANSRFTADMVRSRGITVSDIIHPPINTNFFKPVENPGEDYVLTYVGKETEFKVLKALADNGIKIVAFGSKVPWLPKWFTRHSMIDYKGRVSDDELVKLYANAKFTVFPFTHEPFGYVPVESMACGTPVLTYNKQGPAETVINNETGWLVNNPSELVDRALRIWNNGYPNIMRIKARERALNYSEDLIMRRWLNLVSTKLTPSLP
ncbi:MAG: glycosyltransferase family 4 protein [Vulcanisaeta sp. AZ3]